LVAPCGKILSVVEHPTPVQLEGVQAHGIAHLAVVAVVLRSASAANLLLLVPAAAIFEMPGTVVFDISVTDWAASLRHRVVRARVRVVFCSLDGTLGAFHLTSIR